MKKFFLPLVLLSFWGCKEKLKPGELKFKEIGWTIQFPLEKEFLNRKQIDSIQRATLAKVSNNLDKEVDYVGVKTLFYLLDNRFNGFNSAISKFDRSFGTWEKTHQDDKQTVLTALNAQKSNIEIIDTISSQEVIDDISFEKLLLKIYYPKQNVTSTTIWYAQKVNNYDLTINISFTDEKIGTEYLKILRASKFEK
jgi:hypothetical protein